MKISTRIAGVTRVPDGNVQFDNVEGYIQTHTFTDPSSAHVGLTMEFVMERAELQYAIKSKQ